jgi:hypothetical protein
MGFLLSGVWKALGIAARGSSAGSVADGGKVRSLRRCQSYPYTHLVASLRCSRGLCWSPLASPMDLVAVCNATVVFAQQSRKGRFLIRCTYQPPFLFYENFDLRRFVNVVQ